MLVYLQAVNAQVASVQEIVNPLLAIEEGLRLSQLIVVVRELQIATTTVYIQSLTKDLGSHGRALNVPTGATLSPRRIPRRLSRLGRLLA